MKKNLNKSSLENILPDGQERPRWVEKLLNADAPGLSGLITEDLKRGRRSTSIYYTVTQVSKKLGITVARINKLEQEGFIKPRLITVGKHRRYHEDQLADIERINQRFEAKIRQNHAERLNKPKERAAISIDMELYLRLQSAVKAKGSGSVSQYVCRILRESFEHDKVHIELMLDKEAFDGFTTQGNDITSTLNQVGKLLLEKKKQSAK